MSEINANPAASGENASSENVASENAGGLSAGLRRRAAALALGVLGCGFVAGYGYGYGVNRQMKQAAQNAPLPVLLAPLVKGMHLSPNSRWLAFTAVYDRSQRSSRFVFDVGSKQFSAQESPAGWQDFVVQWDAGGRNLLVKREKIPRPAADASAGFYRQRLLEGNWPRLSGSLDPIEPDLPAGERVVSGFWDGRDQLAVKTRREPKSLYYAPRGKLGRIDRSAEAYLQNRAVIENGRTVFYVVKSIGNASGAPVALFRVGADGKQTRQLSEALEDVEWAYVAENGRWMIVARYDANGVDWQWSLYRVGAGRAQKTKTSRVPGDVISVYWSPDTKRVLGASGQSLWLIDVPSLTAKKLGDKSSANADDAAWSGDSRAVWVASDGKLLKVGVPDGRTQMVWKFPDAYWTR